MLKNYAGCTKKGVKDMKLPYFAHSSHCILSQENIVTWLN